VLEIALARSLGRKFHQHGADIQQGIDRALMSYGFFCIGVWTNKDPV
jgi:ribosomal protein S3